MKILKKLVRHLKLTKSKGIVRRYFITNAFDGILTTLGIIIGSYYVNIKEPKIILAATLGGAVAIAISGISSAYLSEKAEKIRKLKKLEKALLRSLDSSVLANASKTAVWIAALANGLSPLICSLIVLTPILLVELNLMHISLMYPLSFLTCVILLFGLGYYLGTISKENRFFYGLKTLFAGVIVAFVLIFLKFI